MAADDYSSDREGRKAERSCSPLGPGCLCAKQQRRDVCMLHFCACIWLNDDGS